jgi:ABC-type phosphate/phosphonate transport system substrate-binding protein
MLMARNHFHLPLKETISMFAMRSTDARMFCAPHSSGRYFVGSLSLILLLHPVACPAWAAGKADSATPSPKCAVLSIGMAQSLFRDVPASMMAASREPIRALMQEATGLRSEVKPPRGAGELAECLLNGALHFAVFQGIEFAWQKQRHPELRPLLLAVNETPGRRSHVIIRKDAPVQQWSDLRGKSLAIPRGSREHVLLFAEQSCLKYGLSSRDFFRRIASCPCAEDALDDVVDRNVESATVDSMALKAYQRRKPGRSAQLRVLCSSQKFPDSVVAFIDGTLDPGTRERCRAGLLRADKMKASQRLLTLWGITRFEEAPAGFDGELAEICRSYPPPAPTLVAMPAGRSSGGLATSNSLLLAQPR